MFRCRARTILYTACRKLPIHSTGGIATDADEQDVLLIVFHNGNDRWIQVEQVVTFDDAAIWKAHLISLSASVVRTSSLSIGHRPRVNPAPSFLAKRCLLGETLHVNTAVVIGFA